MLAGSPDRRERLRPPDSQSPLAPARFARVMELLSPRQQPLDSTERPELAASFWMRGTLAIAGIPQAVEQYREYERVLEGGIYRGEPVHVADENGNVSTADEQALQRYYAHVGGVLTDLIRVRMDVPGEDTFALIPQAAALQRGKEFGRELQEWYEEFQVRRAEETLGIKLGSSNTPTS